MRYLLVAGLLGSSACVDASVTKLGPGSYLLEGDGSVFHERALAACGDSYTIASSSSKDVEGEVCTQPTFMGGPYGLPSCSKTGRTITVSTWTIACGCTSPKDPHCVSVRPAGQPAPARPPPRAQPAPLPTVARPIVTVKSLRAEDVAGAWVADIAPAPGGQPDAATRIEMALHGDGTFALQRAKPSGVSNESGLWSVREGSLWLDYRVPTVVRIELPVVALAPDSFTLSVEQIQTYRRIKPAEPAVTAAPKPSDAVTASSAAADPLDTVVLTRGGRLRGTVLEMDPNKGVTLRQADGFEWKLRPEEVKSVEFGRRAP